MRAATVSRKFAANLLLFCASSETHLPCASVRLQTCLDSGIVAGSLTALYDPGLPPRGQSLPSFRTCLAARLWSAPVPIRQQAKTRRCTSSFPHTPLDSGLPSPSTFRLAVRPVYIQKRTHSAKWAAGRRLLDIDLKAAALVTLNSSLLEGFSAVPGFHGVVKSHGVVESPSATLGGPCHTMHGLPCNVFLQVWVLACWP
ncbi:hypothetical protein CCMSSC00406_0010263 [Pleurotus cornucopiae]|uniref:Uncharacterized protein n=1 Tax=Pleurotus cornucopiae TaxID=5321 RepID=A0ACB7IUI3_PLECO|nr:hypothetical protein CCMSSC00406_0010263 [Pleurotus cornucopiae]